MAVPQVVIVGRPNVGKSSIFNWLAGRRLAVVDPTSGVTRDRLTHLIDLNGQYAELVDTGGVGIVDADNLAEHVEQQIQTAIDSADVILLVVNVRDGVVPLDEEVAKRLRYVTVPVLCVANKADHPELDANSHEFSRLGRKVMAISALQNRGKPELIRELVDRLPGPELDAVARAAPVMKIAIVGRRNTGKSTFVNTLVETERMITSEVPGTTRDSVDVQFELDGQQFIAIDTPGFRRGKSVSTDLDFYSTHRAERSVRRSDVVLLFFDASQRISKVDKQLCSYIAASYKPCVFVVNKWDLLVDSMPTEKWVTYLRDTFRMMWHVPIAFITGQTGKNAKKMLNHSQMLFKQARNRVPTPRLNKLVHAALEYNPPPAFKNRRPKIYYATQVGECPPTIVIFCNNPKAFSTQYRRYLLGVFREKLDFPEVPIKLYLRQRERDDVRDDVSSKLKK